MKDELAEQVWDYRCRMCKAEVVWDGSKESACPKCGDTIDPCSMTLHWNLADGSTIGKLAKENGMDGAERIAAERERQYIQEPWSETHDDDHEDESLARAAACYATPPNDREWAYPDGNGRGIPKGWPWAATDWKPTNRVRELEKAGALIAAEIDRLLRAQVNV